VKLCLHPQTGSVDSFIHFATSFFITVVIEFAYLPQESDLRQAYSRFAAVTRKPACSCFSLQYFFSIPTNYHSRSTAWLSTRQVQSVRVSQHCWELVHPLKGHRQCFSQELTTQVLRAISLFFPRTFRAVRTVLLPPVEEKKPTSFCSG
jgi:hypothetical protein